MKTVFRACLLLMISAAFCSCDNAGGTDGIGWGRIELMNSFYHLAPPEQEALLLSAFFGEAELTAQDDESFQTQLETPNGITCDVSLHDDTESLYEIDATQLDVGEIRAGTEDDYLSITFAEGEYAKDVRTLASANSSEGEYAKDVRTLASANSSFPQWMNEPDTEVFISGLGNEHLDAFTLPIRFGTLPVAPN